MCCSFVPVSLWVGLACLVALLRAFVRCADYFLLESLFEMFWMRSDSLFVMLCLMLVVAIVVMIIEMIRSMLMYFVAVCLRMLM